MRVGATLGTMHLPQLRTLDLDGPTAVREWPGEGPTIVLLHGLGASHLSWVQIAEPLSGLGRIVAIDLPGFGDSPSAGRGAGLMDQRRTVSKLIASIGGPVVLVGSSMGGALGIVQAAVEPGTVRGLVLSNSVFPWRLGRQPNPLVLGAFATYATPGLGERFVSWRLHQMEPEQLVRLGLAVLAADARSIPEDVVALLVEQTRRRRDDPETVPAFLGAARSLVRLGRKPAVARRALDNVTCPVLVVHGRRDRFVPAAFAEAELALHPTWRGRFFADLGHIAHMEAPGRWVSEVADWSAASIR
jgi:pimeloyl-ACP methyl ester carboxylesterase